MPGPLVEAPVKIDRAALFYPMCHKKGKPLLLYGAPYSRIDGQTQKQRNRRKRPGEIMKEPVLLSAAANLDTIPINQKN